MRSIERRWRPLALPLLAFGALGGIASGCMLEPSSSIAPPRETTALPPPISGGTLTISRDKRTAIAADPDRDLIWIADVEARALTHKVALKAGDEPGRVIEDAHGRVHVVLRGSGALATLDAASGKVTNRRDVCPAPRGIAYDATGDVLHVACASGEIVTLPAAGGAATRTIWLERDLRDIVVDGDRLLVSRLKTADMLVVNADGKIAQRALPPEMHATFKENPMQAEPESLLFEPTVAWRMIAAPEGGVVLVHQRASTRPIQISVPEGSYGDGRGPNAGGICDESTVGVPSITHGAVSTLSRAADGTFVSSKKRSHVLPQVTLPVDVALSPSGHSFASVGAGSYKLFQGTRATGDEPEEKRPCTVVKSEHVPGQPTAVAFLDEARVVVQFREPAALYFPESGETLTLPGESRFDVGHDVFHTAPTPFSNLSCASCHPEGHEDGRVWNFDPIGARRTQDISGGVMATLPLHWDGDMMDMSAIMIEVLGRRMGGSAPGPERMERVEAWIDAIPTLPLSAPRDEAAVARGEALFHDAKVACASCHGGDSSTNNESRDVGTGKPFQIPSLRGVAHRAPFMHDGCAPTLAARFAPGACGGGDAHGKTSHLSQAEIEDLVAYIETL